MRPRVVPALLALALIGCGSDPAPTAPDGKPGMRIEDGHLVLPAVKGNPGAAYFTVINDSAAPATLSAVHIDGAGKAELHETKGTVMAPLTAVAVPGGEKLEFAPGARHVMAFGLPERFKPGTRTEMTVSFAGGDKVSAPLEITAPGSHRHGAEP